MPAADVHGAPAHALRNVRQKGHAALLVVLFQTFQKGEPQLLPRLFRGQRLIGCLRQRINKTFEPFAERSFAACSPAFAASARRWMASRSEIGSGFAYIVFFIEKSSISPKALPVISPAGHTISCKFFVFPRQRSIFSHLSLRKAASKARKRRVLIFPIFQAIAGVLQNF